MTGNFAMSQTEQKIQGSETGQGKEGNSVVRQSLEPELEEGQGQPRPV